MKTNTSILQRFYGILFAAILLMAGSNAEAQIKLTCIDGTNMNSLYGEGCEKLVDGQPGTKWCQVFSGSNTPYVIFRASEALVPKNYYLLTAGDANRFPERNWRTWYIYGANFENDDEATKDANGWVLVDQKLNVGTDMLPAKSLTMADFTCSEDNTTAYKYYKIEVKAIMTLKEGDHMQMAEFSFGSSEQSETFSFTALSTSTYNGDVEHNEGAFALVDGISTTKWVFNQLPSWMVFKSNSPLAPTFYSMVTGNDTQQYPGRNWRDWQIYGGNFASDADAQADAEGWVLIDNKTDIGTDILPPDNYKEAILDVSEGVSTAFKYFKVVVTTNMGQTYSQMSELTLGTASDFEAKKKSYLDDYKAYDLSITAYKPYKDAYNEAVATLQAAANCAQIRDAMNTLEEAKANITQSALVYQSYANSVSIARGFYENGQLSGEGMKVIGDYLNTNAGPSSQYPNGTFPYIMEQQALSDDAINDETAFLGELIEKYANNLTEGAIETTYQVLDATEGYASTEDASALFDGDSSTKWCHNHKGGLSYVVFKAEEPITPSYYRLVTANDTKSFPGRNWKTYKIYGGNFPDPDHATREADGWVLLDDKKDVGKDQIPADNFAEAYLYLSQPSNTPYEYFKIEITESVSGSIMQMSEFSFANNANLFMLRQEYYEEFADFNLTDIIAQQALIDQYTKSLESMLQCTTVTYLTALRNTLTTLQGSIEKSAERYAEYETYIEDIIYEYLDDLRSADPTMAAYFDYNTETAPGETFTLGSYTYIMNHREPSATQLANEINFWKNYIAALSKGGFVVITGNGAWNSNENWTKLVDRNPDTKWGTDIPDGGAYIIFKTIKAIQPFFFSLTTGDDTKRYNGRNWADWKIYGGNFAENALATRDAQGWELMDSHEAVGDDVLPAENKQTVYFAFSEPVEKEYKYFLVEVTKAFDGTQMQMAEMAFGTKEDFEKLRDEFCDKALEFDLDVVAEKSLLDEYEIQTLNLTECEDMVALAQNYSLIGSLQDRVRESMQAYAAYKEAADEIKEYVGSNTLETCEALDRLMAYLTGGEKPGDTFPNGSFNYVYETGSLNRDEVLEETDYMKELWVAAMKQSYTPGTEITPLVENADFAQGTYLEGNTIVSFTGWEGTGYTFGRNDAGAFAAENARQQCDIHQTITGLKNGIYELRMNAVCRPCGDVLSKNYAAQIYANDNVVYVQSAIEDMIPVEDAVDGVNCHTSGTYSDKAILDEVTGDTIGFVPWGVAGSACAFSAGRYENVICTNVTDGTLTIGIKDPGTTFPDDDWMAFGNTRLIYHGTLDSSDFIVGINNALGCCKERALSLIEWESSLDGREYKQKPNYAQTDRKALEDMVMSPSILSLRPPKEMYEMVEELSSIFKRIYETKPAYITLFEGEQKVYDKWGARYSIMNGEEQKAFENAIETIETGLLEGEYSANEALQAKADLYAHYPDYLERSEQLDQSSSVMANETAPFEYDITISGTMPYMALSGLYEDLAEDQTVLTFEYTAPETIKEGSIYTDTDITHLITYKDLEATADWKKVYIDFTTPCIEWGWGDASSTIRWAMTTASSQQLKARHFLMITPAQMQAEGGSFTGTGIEMVQSSESKVQGNGVYDLMGRKINQGLKSLPKGIYIVNGKKVMVK